MNTSFFKRIQGYRTLAVNGLIMALGLGTMVGVVPIGVTAEGAMVGVDMALGGAEMILGAVNVFLRMITSTPVLKSE